MQFIQIIEFETDQIDEVRKLDEEWRAKARAEGATAQRGILCADRDGAGRYLQIVFFDSYEAAERNSSLPFTQDFAARITALGKGEPTFRNLDVVEDLDYPE